MTDLAEQPPVVVWFGSPPMVERGAFDGLARSWPAPVIYVATAPVRNERKELGWTATPGAATELIVADDYATPERAVASICERAPGALHIFAGFAKPVATYMKIYLDEADDNTCMVFSERFGAHGPAVRKTIRRILTGAKQRYIYRRFGSRVSLLFPLGSRGRSTFARVGWPEYKMRNLMYCPPVDPDLRHDRERFHNRPLRLLYVGRLTKYTKGFDVLLESIPHLPGHGWHLTIIGAHGEMIGEAQALAAEDSRVTYLGPLPSSEVQANMQDHDLLIVPSTFDGWNVSVNLALLCGLPVVCSDEAVSDELIANSGAGMIFTARDNRSLAKILTRAITDPELVDSWAAAAVDYSRLISPDAVGGYLARILSGFLASQQSEIRAPW